VESPKKCVDVESFTAIIRTHQHVPKTGPRASALSVGSLTGRCTETGDLTTSGGGLTVYSCIVHELTPIALDHFSGRDPIGRSSPKGCSRSVRPPRTSQTTTGMKKNGIGDWKRELGQKEQKQKKY
jgi:hypothetical protein